MTDAARDAAELRRGLRRVRLSVAAGLAVCALLVATRPGGAADASGTYLALAFALALGSILSNQAASRPGRSVRSHVQLSIASALCAGGIGLVGVAAWLGAGNRNLAIGCILCGALFALRPEAVLAARRRRP
ncbi:MAG: hypothetical protein JSU66_06110 [Deltaproteobacteria bacterium]|nr:MAG: hypothetical protein JSU66_06110 [Deltaproteobacteria bacterium]